MNSKVNESNYCIALNEQQKQQLTKYAQLLQHWGKRLNLVADLTDDSVLNRHINDSLAIAPDLADQGQVMDLGTGAGLPGIPLAIARPDLTFILLDSRGKRVEFLRHVVYQLKCENVIPVHSRVELHQFKHRNQQIICRAVASLTQIIEWSWPSLAVGGQILAMKGRYPEQELKEIPQILSNKLKYKVKSAQTEASDIQRHLVIIEKMND